MKFSKHKLVCAIGLAVSASTTSTALLAADTIIATSKRLINGNEYSFEKLMAADGNVYQRIFENGIEVKGEPRVVKTVVDPLLLKKLSAIPDTQTLKVNLSLVPAAITSASDVEQGGLSLATAK